MKKAVVWNYELGRLEQNDEEFVEISDVAISGGSSKVPRANSVGKIDKTYLYASSDLSQYFSQTGDIIQATVEPLENQATSANGATFARNQGVYFGSSFDNAFDGDDDTTYFTNMQEYDTLIITVTLSGSPLITYFRLYQSPTDHVRNWQLHSSTDNTNWTLQAEDQSDLSVIDYDTGVTELAAPVEAQYWRFTFPAYSRHTNYGAAINQIELYTGAVSTVPYRLAIGEEGQVLTSVSGMAAWADAAASGGSGDATSLQGRSLSANAPSEDQVLAWDGSEWIPTTFSGGGGDSSYSDPLTADGDIIVRSGGVTTRLPIGSDTQILRVVSGAPSWSNESAGGGSGDATSLQGNAIAVTSPTDGQVLTWNETESRWEPDDAAAGSDLPAVGTDGQVLTVVGGEAAWADATGGSGDAISLQGNTVHDALPTGGQALVWNDTESRWEPGNVGGSVDVSELEIWREYIQLTGEVNGINKLFQLPSHAKPGSVSIFTAPSLDGPFFAAPGSEKNSHDVLSGVTPYSVNALAAGGYYGSSSISSMTDGNTSTFWSTRSTALAPVVEWDTQIPVKPFSVYLHDWTSGFGGCYTYKLEASNDMVDWTVIAASADRYVDYPIICDTAYQYWRVTGLTKGHYEWAISEVRLYVLLDSVIQVELATAPSSGYVFASYITAGSVYDHALTRDGDMVVRSEGTVKALGGAGAAVNLNMYRSFK